jgi:hypothetical protein
VPGSSRSPSAASSTDSPSAATSQRRRSAPDALALTADGGSSWQLVSDAPNEYRSGAAWVTGSDAVVVGPTGSDVSTDGGGSWERFDDGSFDTVDCAGKNACWASGEQGRAAHLVTSH